MARRRNPEATREKIMDATLEIFREKGYEETTINDIVDRLEGLTRGAFYHHFKSKEDVLNALLESRYEKEMNLDNLKKLDGLNGLEKMRKFLISDLREAVFDGETGELIEIFIELLDDPKFLHQHIKENQGEHIAWLQYFIEEGIADGSIKKQDPYVLTEFILLLMNVWMMPTIYDATDEAVLHERWQLAKKVLEALGCPVITDELLASWQDVDNNKEG